MLFVNLDLIIELLGYNIHECSKDNKLLYYDDISNTTLKEDITFDSREKQIINSFCELEIYKSSLIGNNVAGKIRSNFGLSVEREKELFTKLFVRDYLVKKENRTDLSLENYLSSNQLFANVRINEIKDKLTGIKLFEDFASIDLKNDKEFAKVILQLDGSYITAMGERVRNSTSAMEVAIKNDETKEVISFASSNTKLSDNAEFAILYFKKMQQNQGKEFSPEKVYEDVFKQENGKYPKTIFKNDEQSSWMKDSIFLPGLAKISNQFVNLIANGDISPLSDSDNKKMVKSTVKQG